MTYFNIYELNWDWAFNLEAKNEINSYPLLLFDITRLFKQRSKTKIEIKM